MDTYRTNNRVRKIAYALSKMCVKEGSTYYNLLNESGDDVYPKGQRQVAFVRDAWLRDVCVQGAKREAWQGGGGVHIPDAGCGPSGQAQRSAAS